jgi:hypothetical protein
MRSLREFPFLNLQIMENKEKYFKEKVAEWFSSKSYLEQHALSDVYFESRHPSLLTMQQVEDMYLEELNK